MSPGAAEAVNQLAAWLSPLGFASGWGCLIAGAFAGKQEWEACGVALVLLSGFAYAVSRI